MRAVLFVSALIVLAASANAVSLWPMPMELFTGSNNVSLIPGQFAFTISGQSSPVLQDAIKRYTSLIFWNRANNVERAAYPVIGSLDISVSSPDTTLQYGVEESYTLTIDASGSRLVASTVWGALHGLETFSQCVEYNDAEGYVVHGTLLHVVDLPRFNWRGLLVDTARHYLPPQHLQHVIDTLAYNKMNVLHWHIVDAQSFPVQIQAYPQLSQAGAYHPSAIFTAQDVQNVVQYGYDRGVRVMVEIDGPGHAYSWGLGMPQITANCPSLAANVNNIPLNPTLPLTMQVVQAVYAEMAQLFPDSYLHMGGDELVTDCWSDDPQIAQYMKQHGMSTTDLYQWFETQTHQMAAALNRTVVNWQEVFDYGLNVSTDTTIIHVWKDQATLGNAVKAGYKALLSAGWYLDKQFPTPEPTHYEWEDTWINLYLNEPFQGLTLTDAEKARVLGGEAAMWGEQVDQHNFDSRVWPRAGAAAERLWSPETVLDLNSAKARLNDHACRMERRGVNCGPIAPGFCQMPQQ